MPQQPRNRQEFMRMQEQAVAAARDMQKRTRFSDQELMPKPQSPPQRPKFNQPRCGGMHHKTPNRKPKFRAQGSGQQQWQEPARNCKRQRYYQPPPPEPPPPPPPSPPPPSPAPGLSELFTLFGGMGGGSNTPPQNCESCEGKDGDGSMDSVLVILLMFLLQKEKADQGLMMALMYIMM